MGLAEQQAFLARLYTDGALRKAFFAAPGEVGAQWRLSEAESEHLAQLSARQVGQFAQSLHSKRAGELRHLLPATSAALGQDFAPLFRSYAPTFLPQGHYRHRTDALQFVAFLQATRATITPWILDVARYEGAWLEMGAGQRVLVRHFRYQAHVLVMGLNHAESLGLPARRPCIGCWLRRGAVPVRCVMLPTLV